MSAAQSEAPLFVASGVTDWSKAESDVQKWGEIRKFFIGQTTGLRDMFSAISKIAPGEEIHRPHRHLEEEFLVIMRGCGMWHLNGKEFPAREDDVLYVEPWASHGITNTGTEPLVCFIAKWIGREPELIAKPK